MKGSGAFEVSEGSGELAIPACGREQWGAGGRSSLPSKAGSEEKDINREGWAPFKPLLRLCGVFEIQAKGYVGSKLEGRGSRA